MATKLYINVIYTHVTLYLLFYSIYVCLFWNERALQHLFQCILQFKAQVFVCGLGL